MIRSSPLLIKVLSHPKRVVSVSHQSRKQLFGFGPPREPPNFRFELPPLMDFNPRYTAWPMLTKLKINWLLKPLVDKQFDPFEFMDGAKQAVSAISTHLANDDIEKIRTLVTQEAFEEIVDNYRQYSPGQKLMLKVNTEDILVSYVFGVNFKRLGFNRQKVKILVVHDVLNNASEVITKTQMGLMGRKMSSDFRQNLEVLKPVIDQKFLCIYLFSREYGPNGKNEWIVEKLVHFKNTDILRLNGLIS